MYARTLVSAFLKPRSQWFSQCFRNIHRQNGPYIYIYIYADLVASVFCLYIYLVTWDDS